MDLSTSVSSCGSSVTSLGDHNAVVDKLTAVLSNKLNIDGGNSTNNTNHMQQLLKGNYIFEDDQDEEDEDDFSEEGLTGYMTKSESSKHERMTITTSKASLNLVSALKGSRSKEQGKPKSRVSWAPDVYDPTPATEDDNVFSLFRSCMSEYDD